MIYGKTEFFVQKIEGKWYAFMGCEANDQVYSIGKDNPPTETGCSRYVARWSDEGIKSVASPVKTKRAALERARRAAGSESDVIVL